MRRACGQDRKRLFAVDDFLTVQQNHFILSTYGCQEEECHRGRGDRWKRKFDLWRDSRNHRKASCWGRRVTTCVRGRGHGCCYSYMRVTLCRMNRDELRAKKPEGAIWECFNQFHRGEAILLGILLEVLSILFERFFPIEKVLICLVWR